MSFKIYTFTEASNVIFNRDFNAFSKVDRHLRGEAHQIALMIDNRQPEEERLESSSASSAKRPLQPDIGKYLNDSSRESFKMLMKTAYEMVLTPSMPHKHFKVLVKCQRENGVRLVQGKDGSNAAREYIHCIADAMKEKCAAVIAGRHFISILSDGSQARKTNDEKELILVRTERNGIPVYFVVSLLEMANLGGSTADSIKKAIDSVFSNGSEDDDENDAQDKGPMPLIDYNTKVVSATADGASVNFGVYSGVLTQLKNEREWLVMIHCVNHRLELALKAVVQSFDRFSEVDSFYQSIWSLLKNSGKLKAEIKTACEALNITCYELSKIHGTRFLNHRRRGLKKLLHNWPALITAFDNALATTVGYRPETRAKLTGFLKKLKSYPFLCQVAGYLDVLETLGPLSLVFEGKNLMAFEIPGSVEKTLNALEEISEEDEHHLSPSSYLAKFRMEEGFEGETGGHVNDVRITYPKAGHEKRKPPNREYLEVSLEQMEKVGIEAVQRTVEIREDAADRLRPVIRDRFSSFDQEVFKTTMWLDPKFWDNSDKEYGNKDITKLCDRFEKPLAAASFEHSSVLKEWRSLKVLQKTLYPKMEAGQLWEKVLCFRREEFPNLSLLVELALCISGSNSQVERGFSILTLILSNRRLSMSHDVMERCIMIASNDPNWSMEERESIINRAVDIYMAKRRTAVFPKEKQVATNHSESDPAPLSYMSEDESESSDDSDEHDN